ncbi:hypothetical protein HO133_003329 [Letharia lupina]|uniref:Cytochrome c oxidase assembly factor 3 n=2 Tax=Letharia TaxID=112415 RepID=A0A8H6CAZ2_9LECA|nr:uncharacterized protein HO133_003329 [Letharia lupina]XP_037165914.1 uncharacterized protein HO173_005356 [Letharia columbiana]KAF6220198.1 hypothetical protein HO133_003329 [Letharia lupina]KAF6236575.1 hypothetical protein HO173_005356 [Letharia columbiana]
MAILPRSSYYDKHYRPAASLIRARQPYLIRNMVTGLALCAFTIGVYSWTINAVAQDDFSDVPIPDAPAQSPHSPHTGLEKSVSAAALDEQKEKRLKS